MYDRRQKTEDREDLTPGLFVYVVSNVNNLYIIIDENIVFVL